MCDYLGMYVSIMGYVCIMYVHMHDHVVYVNIHIHVFRLIHAFTCAGILPSQYMHFSKFATLGVVGKWGI